MPPVIVVAICGNGRTITRQKIEDRVLARIRQGLIAPELMATFAEEVARLLAAEHQIAPATDLPAQLAKLEARIARLLDQIEEAEGSAGIAARLKEREAEREALLARIAAAAQPASLAAPSPADLKRAYAASVQRLERCLSEGELTVAANGELRRLLGKVVVRPDAEAPDGLAIEIRGDLGRILAAGCEAGAAKGTTFGATTQSGVPKEAVVLFNQMSVVAGARNLRDRHSIQVAI